MDLLRSRSSTVTAVKLYLRFSATILGSLWFMAYSDFLKLLLAIGIWCAAYITVAVVASFRVFNSLCTL
ncbi:hypothetical protein L6164_000308 [Bauhinia variegata]|uniref:Uncharacterized protein n=1 Tax=Bauhinia variegata TaxID=167791 RepID=A0ACB9Q5M2_BAUVA|nr:hypothetical protein L6164_000308 [Bauhinia variegata]